MKLAKKILSVVLAVVLALGAFAVVGSANGTPDADYQVKVWLTGSVGSANWTSNSKVVIDEGDESDAGATIEVQPGDTVFVRLYVTNNYYVHTFQANLFYSAELIDAAAIYSAQRGRDITAANLKKIHIWNSNNYWAGLQGTSYSAQNAWTLQADAFNTDVEQNWPTDDSGNNLFNIDEWKFNRLNNLVTEGVGETCIWEEEEHIIMMPVVVPETAQPGDTFYVTIPEGTEQRESKPKGALRLYENGIADGEDEPCDVVDTQAALYPNMKYGDDLLYWDLSEATLTLQVPGGSTEPDEPEVSYADLEAKMAEAAGVLAAGNLTASSVTALNNAITVGNAALSSNDQTVVDSAVAQLTAAIANAEGLANYAALNAAIARYEALNPADWSNFADATAKYDAAKAIAAGLGVSAQGTIDAAAAALNEAIDNLKAALNYSDLEAKYNELADKDVANFTDDTVARFNAALAAANALVTNQNAADQDEIDAAYNELVAADAALDEKAADYSALNEQIARYRALNAKDWTPDSFAKATEAYEAAIAIDPALKISAQATIDEKTAALKKAIDELVPAEGANYAALDAAIAEAKALVADHYVSFADVAAALANAEAVARDLTANDQAIVDAAAKALTDAITALVPAAADYTAVNAAKAAAAAKVAENDEGTLRYTDASIAAINEAVAAVVEGLEKKDQATVDAYAAAINDAIANVEYRPYDYSAIIAHIEAIEANPADYYDATSYANYLAKKEALNWNYTHANYAQAKLQQIQFLKVTVAVAAAADYSAVDAAIEAFEAKIAAGDYEQAGIDAVIAYVSNIDRTLNANAQATVDAYAAEIARLTAELVEIIPAEPANYAALDAAIAAAKALDSSKYVSFGAVIDALYDAQNVDRDLTIDDQAIVDAATKALNDAMASLEEKANYAALDAALAEAAALNKNAWTADSWAALEAAVADGKAISRILGVSAQGTIDAAAAAITAAIADLDAKEVTSSVTEITYTPSEDTHNTFEVKVAGRMAMVQFIEMDGGTRTYDRYNKNVTIVSYNAAGEVVNSLDRSVAYEIWTINTNLIGPDVKVRTKYLEGNQYIWETEKYSFTLEIVEPTFDANVLDIQAPTSGAKGKFAVTVVTGSDAQGIKFVMENGTTTTYMADKATADEDGNLVFSGYAWANAEGLNTIVIKVKVNGAWVEKGAFSYTVE